MKNNFYIRRKRKVLLPAPDGGVQPAYVVAMVKNIESLGFACTPNLCKQLGELSFDQLVRSYHEIITCLKKEVGDHVEFKPFYPDFPDGVKTMGNMDLYFNAFMHYLTGLTPKFPASPRPEINEAKELVALDVGSEEDFIQAATSLIEAKRAWSNTDKEDVNELVKSGYVVSLPDERKMSKENNAFLTALVCKQTKEWGLVRQRLHTATDVLRFVVALSDGDVSLASHTKFGKLKRSERRAILEALEKLPSITEDMLRQAKPWIRVGEKLHPFEYRSRYPKCYEAFKVLRNNLSFPTFASKVESAFKERDIEKALSLLQTRPGELARRLDYLLRESETAKNIIEAFVSVADNVSTPVLLQVHAHFKHRSGPSKYRVFFPKGAVAKAHSVDKSLKPLPTLVALAVVEAVEEVLVRRFAKLKPLGKVFIDTALANYTVPLYQRSASKALLTIARGSRLKLGNKSTIRFFLWWKEGFIRDVHTGRVDLDLSAVMYGPDWEYLTHVSYTNLRSYGGAKDGYVALHSGDITSAPDGACEFIDLDVPSLVNFGARYIVTSVNSFTNHPYCNLPECFAGWMMRESPGSGEIFDARTVENKFDITSDTRVCIPVIIDLHDKTVIWTDIALTSAPRWVNSVERNQDGMIAIGKGMSSLTQPVLYDLFMLHAKARGVLVDKAEADIIFAEHEGIMPTDATTIIADYL
jgi:hypothetical protein